VANLDFPSVVNPAYAGSVSRVRSLLSEIASKIDKSPDLADEVAAQLAPLVAITGLSDTQAVLTSASTVPVKNSAGTTQEAAGDVTVAAGEVSGVALPATKTVVASGAVIPITSGTGTTSITVTVAAGVISAAVLA
jgi:hypothetical protein